MKLVKYLKNNKLLTVMLMTYSFLLITNRSFFLDSFNESTFYLIEMVEIMPLILVLTALIEIWIPKDVIAKNLGEKSGIKGILYALMIGSFSAGPIYAAFPIAKLLMKKGAGVGNIVVILSAWAVIKVPMLLNEAKFLGVDFMIVRWILTVVAIVIIAKVMSKKVKLATVMNNFDQEAVNKTIYVTEYCMGCGICTKEAPELFGMDNRKAYAKKSYIESKHERKLDQVIRLCPVKAIIKNDDSIVKKEA